MAMNKNLRNQLLKLAVFLCAIPIVYYSWDRVGSRALTNAVHPPAAIEPIRLGTLAPNFTVLPELVSANQKFSLYQLKGSPVILHFWATWCGPCLQELPEILKLEEQLRPQGYRFVAIAVDQSWAVIEEFFLRNPQLRPIRDRMILVLDPDSKVANSFGSSRFPETFLINRELVIDNKFIGAQPWSDTRMLPYLDSLRGSAK
jgi:cytochrome c biogenesis protein CcmG/thiol:disulfide interchange protein DsbE